MLIRATITSAFIAGAIASSADKDAACPNIHVFGARETTAPPGYGSAGTFVNLILTAHPGATSQAIVYPAAGGTNALYASSVQNGTQEVANQVNAFNKKCPATQLVYIGYSQGAEIFDNALCGGGDPNQGVTYTNSLISAPAAAALKAVIWAGDPRHNVSSPYNYGNSTAGGFDAREAGFSCGRFASRIRSYCDAADPYCSNGDQPSVHQGYGLEYGQNALEFVNARLTSYSYGGDGNGGCSA